MNSMLGYAAIFAAGMLAEPAPLAPPTAEVVVEQANPCPNNQCQAPR